MDGAERIWLIQTPSASAQAWHEILARACTDRGWDFAVHERGYPTPVATPGRSLLVVSWLDQVEGMEITHRAVQMSPPMEVLALVQAWWGLNDHDALYEASLRLATAWEWAGRGASVSWCDDGEIELAGLGRISGPQGTAPAAPTIADHPLSLYERGTSAGARTTKWSPGLFLYPDARPGNGSVGSLLLVGRRRLLMNGPNIFLPAGYWSFSAEISIDPPGWTELLVEWGHGHEVAALTPRIDVPGRYELSLEKQWTGVLPADFRISLMIPALEGDFEFHGGVLTQKAV